MITVSEALSRILDLAATMPPETVPIASAAGRVLADSVRARRDQPPFRTSAMDGYAVRGEDAVARTDLRVIGTSAAGHGFSGTVGAGEAIRIFTGAPVPAGADRVVIQEDVTRDGNLVTLRGELDSSTHVRPVGSDFRVGTEITAPRRLRPSDLALLASMNVDRVAVAKRPTVALISTGDELVMPGGTPGPDQIVASNAFGLKAMLEDQGARARILPIARDDVACLRTAFELAEGADLVVTIGGASVGDHDLVASVTEELGMELSFLKIAMRPGKPVMAGRLAGHAMIGLPGNPVSSLVCCHVFMLPLIRAMLGLERGPAQRYRAPLSRGIGPNGPREHYMRARLSGDGIAPFDRQDSGLLTVLGQANALLIRPVGDGPREAGESVDYIPI